MMRKRLFRDEVAFTADTDDILILAPRYISGISIALDYLQDGVTAPTLATALTQIALVQVKLGGRVITEMTGTEILALNSLINGREIKYVVPAGDNQQGTIEGLFLPLYLKPTPESLAIRFNFSDLATTDTQQLTFAICESDKILADKRWEIPRFSFTPPSIGAFNEALDTTFAGDLVGLVVYSTTIPTTVDDKATVAKIRIIVEGETIYEGNWLELSCEVEAGAYAGDATLKTILAKYALIDFRADPIPKGKRVEVQIYSDDTNIVRLHPIISV